MDCEEGVDDTPRATIEGASLRYHLSMHWVRLRVGTFSATSFQSMSSSTARPSSFSGDSDLLGAISSAERVAALILPSSSCMHRATHQS